LVGGGASSDGWFHDDQECCSHGVDFSAITADLIHDKSKMSIDCLNSLPISGFARTHFNKDSSNWFLPNFACLESWLKRSGFKMLKGDHSTHPLKKKME